MGIQHAANETEERVTRLLRRFSFVRFDNIDVFARHCVEVSGCQQVPRDPVAILAAYGMSAIRVPLTRTWEGHWRRTDDGYQILVNRASRPEAIRFALLHEALEIIAHIDGGRRFTTSEGLINRLADRFAAAVLIPEEPVRRLAKEFHHPENNKTGVLATRFGTSFAVMRMRLRDLGLAPKNDLKRLGRLEPDGGIEDWEERGRADFQRWQAQLKGVGGIYELSDRLPNMRE